MPSMRILVIGGTQFVGRHFVGTALTRGHDVTLFHRGVTGDDLFPEATHLHGDRNTDLAALDSGVWDVTVDVCAYIPRQVNQLADALGDRGGRYAFISTISVYDDPPGPGIDEDAPLRSIADPTTEVVDGDTYGRLKVLCEKAAHDRFGEVLIIRPGYVVGPYDHTGRFTWWVTRFARGGDILAPGPPDDPMQVIDARDLAMWTSKLIERDTTGTFHAMSPPPPFSISQMFQAIANEVAPAGHSVTWVDVEFLTEEGVDGQALPLWTAHDPQRFVLAANPKRALESGLTPRPLAETITDTLAWASMDPAAAYPGVGLGYEREAELLTLWRSRS
jgi:nucleoside-diphosphate-sugar epimerase